MKANISKRELAFVCAYLAVALGAAFGGGTWITFPTFGTKRIESERAQAKAAAEKAKHECLAAAKSNPAQGIVDCSAPDKVGDLTPNK